MTAEAAETWSRKLDWELTFGEEADLEGMGNCD
jgi:hypothetical protein